MQAIHALGVSLGLEVIAEGIETPAQRDCLRRIGIGSGQGHLFSCARPIEDIRSALSAAAI